MISYENMHNRHLIYCKCGKCKGDKKMNVDELFTKHCHVGLNDTTFRFMTLQDFTEAVAEIISSPVEPEVIIFWAGVKTMSHLMPEPRIYKHQNLMNEFNEAMIRIKLHLFELNDLKTSDKIKPDDFPKPTNDELNLLTHKIMMVLRADSMPMKKH